MNRMLNYYSQLLNLNLSLEIWFQKMLTTDSMKIQLIKNVEIVQHKQRGLFKASTEAVIP